MAVRDDDKASDPRNSLVTRYGQLMNGGLSDGERATQLTTLVLDTLRSGGLAPRKTARAFITSGPGIGVRVDGRDYLVDVIWFSKAASVSQVRAFGRATQPVPHAQPVMLSVSGFARGAVEALRDANSQALLLDRAHLEAMISGLLPPAELFEEATARLVGGGSPHTPLTELLVDRERAEPAEGFVPPHRVAAPPPWEAQTASGVEAQLVLVGEGGWPEPLGLAVRHDQSLLVTTEDGIAEVDAKRGTSRWLLPIAGCAGSALAEADGGVLTMCRGTVVHWKDQRLTVVAGGFPGPASLVAGTGVETWALSGSGVTYGVGAGSLALNLLGRALGEQQRYDVGFGAAVRAAGQLTGRRFFLAAGGHSAVIDLARTSAVGRTDWILSPQSYPAHLVVVGEETVLTASPDMHGVRATIYRTHPATGESEMIATLPVNHVRGLAMGPDGCVYVLADIRGNDVRVPRPVVVRLTGVTPAVGNPAAHPVGATANESSVVDPYARVREAARGNRRDYSLDPRPIARGGQATVTAATHRPSGIRVAVKKLRSSSKDATARMRRELDAARLFGEHPHVMPVLDFGPANDWFVMPLADDTAETLVHELKDPERLRAMVTAVCHALRRPHQEDWIHRDLKPENILRLDERWTVADWGLGRRPRGQTSDARRTQAGTLYGTPGFAAPEQYVDAHGGSSPQTDIYAIGQIIGWVLTGTAPQPNVPLLPDDGPWRNVVKAATNPDPSRRPKDVDELLAVMARELDEPPEIPANRGEQLLRAVRDSDTAALGHLFTLAARHPGDYDLCTEVLFHLDPEHIREGVVAEPAAAGEVVRGMTALNSGGHVTLEHGQVDAVIRWLLVAARAAADSGAWDLLEDSADAIFFWDQRDRWDVQAEIGSWLATLTGQAAAVVAAALRRQPDIHQHFDHLSGDRHLDHQIRLALIQQEPLSPT
ncbi:hypothetical protein DKT69_14065 [Micromonospora sicca]|uniref:non-specific serine/threonine protein kinase n=1 Tax=Micromonospora sicca TaxID=2202420 RepID=A0A317DKF6_9ACTN|nr:serine/threonine-protein kinase [Micromonospora sp. 4G51]PWR14872.1 hypothetical protein DKT69_14065 [Micromonospora sp. 4G51]